jgi:hypothetical protein
MTASTPLPDLRMVDFVSALPPYLLSLAAICSFCLATYFFWQENLKIGAALSGLFFLCVVLAYLPQTESIQAFSVDVRLRRSLDRADDILAQLKEASIANAKTNYMTLAWGNRFDGPKAIEKRSIIAAIDKQLADLKVSQDQRRELSSTFVRLIGLDLYFTYKNVMERLVEAKEHRLPPLMSAASNQERTMFLKNRQEWNVEINRPYTLESFELREFLKFTTPKTMMTDDEISKANSFGDQIIAMYVASQSEANYSKEAAEFIDKSRELTGINDKTREVFGYTFE